MREIQTEIRRDRIENDNRKNELQSKAKSGLKTAKTGENDTSEVLENKNIVSHSNPNDIKHDDIMKSDSISEQLQPQAENKSLQIENDTQKADLNNSKADTALISNVKEINTTISAAHNMSAKASDNNSNIADQAAVKAQLLSDFKAEQRSTVKREIQHQIKHDSIKNSVNIDELHSRAEIGIKTAIAPSIKDVNETIQNKITHQKAFDSFNSIDGKIHKLQKNTNREVQKQILHNNTEKSVKRDELHSKVEGGLKTRKGDNFSLIKSNTKASIEGTFKAAATTGANVGSAASKIIQGAVPNGGSDDLSTESASKVKETAGDTVDKSFNAIKSLVNKKVKSVKASKTISHKQDRVYGIKIKASEKIKNTSKAAGTAVRGVSSAVGTVQNFKGASSDRDISSDLAEQTKDYAEKAVGKGFDTIKSAKDKATETVKHFKNAKSSIRNIKNTQTRLAKGSERAAKKPVKSTKRASRVIQKAAKTGIKTASKTTVKTSTKTARAAAKATAEAAKASAKLTAKAAQLAAKAASAIAEAVGSLASTPVGWVIIAVILVVVIVVVIISAVSNSTVNTVSAVGGAVVSPLSWIFNDSNSSSPDIVAIYLENEEKAKEAMSSARTYYINAISEIGFGERDSIELNGSSYYPASSAESFIQSFFASIDYDDYVYLLEMCYIKKLRDERAAQGLSENEMPEVTLEKEDILNFLIDYCFEFEITIIEGQACPTADCQEDEDTDWHFNDEDCPDVVEDGDTCPGHPYQYTYCDHSHIKAVVTIQQISRDVLENVILVLTDEERTILELGIQLINDALQP